MEMGRQTGAEKALRERELGWPAVLFIHNTHLTHLVALVGDMKGTLKTWTVPLTSRVLLLLNKNAASMSVNLCSSLPLAV